MWTEGHHSMTSSARASSIGGMVMPSAFAVLRLMTSANLVGNSTGKSPGLLPFKILSTLRGRTPSVLTQINPVAHQPTGDWIFAEGITGRKLSCHGQIRNL